MNLKEELEEYLLGNNEKRLELMKKWEKEKPVLYRYRTIESDKKWYELEALEKRDFFASSYEKLNDDKEGMLVQEIVNGVSNDVKKMIIKSIRDFRQKFGVVCFTETGPEDLDAEYMWDNYAEGGQGICLQYKLMDFIEQQFFVVPVRYVKQLSWKNLMLRNKFVPDYTYIMKKEFGKNKDGEQKEWKREREWRHICIIKDAKGNYCACNIEPDKIYCGVNLKAEYKEKIRALYPGNKIVDL